MRIFLITLTLALTLVLSGCSFFGDSPEDPMAAAETPAEKEEVAAGQEPQGQGDDKPTITSTHEVVDIVPEGPLATVELANGSTIEVLGMEKLGKYYVYISGDLNGRTSTVISYTRYQDVARWAAIIFKDPKNFVITTKAGKELVFMNARLFMGSDSNETYGFHAFDDNYDKALIEVPKADVATIKFK